MVITGTWVFQFHACLFHGHGCQRFRDMWLSNTIQARCECMEQDHLGVGVGVGASEACRPCHSSHWQAVGHSQLCTVATAWTQLPVPGSDLQVVGGPVGLMLGASHHEHSDICWEPFYTDTVSLGANSLHACLCLECKRDFYECYHKWFPSEACVTHRAEFVDTIVHLGPVLDTCISNVVRPSGWIMERRQACLGQSRVAMAWWPFAVRPTTAGTLMVGTDCPARACRRWPMQTAWPTKPIIMPGSSWMTCRRPTPVWWVTGSHTSSIYMTSPSFIWDRTSLTRTPATRPSASMPITSFCSRTPGTCPRSPTWTSKCTLEAMASWQLPSRTQQSCVLPATWSWLQPDNAWEISPAQQPISWWRLSWGTCLQARLLGLRRWGGQSRRRQQKGPHYSPTCTHHGNSNLCSRSPPAQLLPSAIAPMMAHSSSSSSASPTITAPTIIAVAWQLHHNNHSKAMMPGLTPRCDPQQLSQARRCHMHLEQGTAQGRQAADSWRW